MPTFVRPVPWRRSRFLVLTGVRRRAARNDPVSRMSAYYMRRRLLFFVALAVLVLPSSALAGRAFSLQLGSTFTITGRTGSDTGQSTRAVGKVVLSGRWAGGSWHVIATTMTDSAGRYRFTIKPRRRSVLTLRIAPPDHHPRLYVLRVR